MAEIKGQSVQVPFRQAIVDKLGMLTADWESFFRALHLRVGPVSPETSFQLKNNQATPLPIDGLKFDKRKVTHVQVEYVIQRVSDFSETVESGFLTLDYLPRSDSWSLWRRPNNIFEARSAIVNNQSTPLNVPGLKFDFQSVQSVLIEFEAFRITTGGGATTAIEKGSVFLISNPSTGSWSIQNPSSHWPNNSGLTFSVDSDGQVKYVSTNFTGDPSVSEVHLNASVTSRNGIAFSVDEDGQIKYSASNIVWPIVNHKLTYRTHSTGARVAIADNSAPPIPP